MGRFYESTAARYVDDKMFQAPSQLMAEAMQAKDAMIDKEVDTVEAYDKLLKLQALDVDNPRANQLISEYHSKIDDIVKGISKNPLDFNNYSRTIRELGRDIQTNWTNGEAANIQNNKNRYDAEIEAIDKLDAKDGYEADFKVKEKARILAKYNEAGGANWNKDLGKATNSLDIADAYHGLKFDDGFLAHMKAKGYSYKKDTKGGDGYIYTKKDSTKQLTPEELAEATYQYMEADPAFQAAVSRRRELGQEGFENADLQTAMVRDEKGQLKGFTDDYYGRKLAATSSYAIYDEDRERTMGTDSAFLHFQSQAREDAKEQAETPELAYTTVFQQDGGNLKTFQNALVQTNTALNNVKLEAGNVAKQLGIKEGSQAYKDIQNGNFSSLAEKVRQGKLSEELYNSYTSRYRTNAARKQLLDAQSISFNEWAKEKKIKGAGTIGSEKGWSTNKEYQNAYREFIKDKGVKQTKDVPLILSFNNMGIDKTLRKNFSDTFVQAFDNVVFKLQGTSKGEEEIRETQDGKRLIYTADKSKAGKFKQSTDPKAKSKWITYVYIPDGNLSMQRLLKDGVVAREDISHKEGKDNILNEKKALNYVTFRGGKSVGITIDNETVGFASGLDNSGRANLGASVTLGNNRAIATIPTEAISSPTLKKYIDSKQEDFEFDRIDNQTNWETIGVISKKIDGHTYHIEKGKAYEDGVEVGSSADLKAVKKLILGY